MINLGGDNFKALIDEYNPKDMEKTSNNVRRRFSDKNGFFSVFDLFSFLDTMVILHDDKNEPVTRYVTFKDSDRANYLILSAGRTVEEMRFDASCMLRTVMNSARSNKGRISLNACVKDRYFSIDLNPNYIGYTVIDWVDSENYKIIDKGCISLKKLNDYDDSLFGKGFDSESKERKYITNKRKYETIDISHELVKIANHYQCEYFVTEDLSIKPKDNKKGKKFNKKCNNQWDRNLIVHQITKVCKLNKIKLLQVMPNYSSFIGNLVYRKEKLFDPILSSIEISRRGYEWVHQYILKDKEIEKNIIFGNFEKDKEVYRKSLEELGVDFPFETFQELYSQIKKSKVRYRFPLESCKNLAVFSKNSIRNYQTLYKFI